MIGHKCLLDSVILISYLRDDPQIQYHMTTSEPYVSVISIGELSIGALRSQSPSNEFQKITRMLTFTTVLECDVVTAEHYAQIKHKLWKKGQPIPENDIWIAATALQYGLPLVSNDVHFTKVSGLTLEQW